MCYGRVYAQHTDNLLLVQMNLQRLRKKKKKRDEK